MSPKEPELTHIGRIGRGLPVTFVLVLVLVAAAVAKPWQGFVGPAASASPSPTVNVESETASPADSGPVIAEAPTAGQADAPCLTNDAWLVVADDVEAGRTVRSWLAAAVTYSAVQPTQSSVPVTTVVSGEVLRLGLCLPLGPSDPGGWSWSGEVWRQGNASEAADWVLAAVLRPGSGPESALAVPVLGQGDSWLPGLYLLMANLPDQTPAWLEVRITPSFLPDAR
jgi:hypothetical protein